MPEWINILPKDGEVYYLPDFFSKQESEKLFAVLLNEIEWQQDEVMMFGKRIVTQRRMAWYGEENKPYRYSGILRTPKPWTRTLLEIQHLVNSTFQTSLNACLMNLYRNGEEGMGWHSDDEPELGKEPIIVSLSLGAQRAFDFKHKDLGNKQRIYLEAGSLLLMKGATQKHWKHALPKSKKVLDPRINLTFREIQNG
ncbi:MAG: alpha-ketoglutarate-dependent dioxygenase AlkB [Chitinophagaceae bacterium]|jgi:alkylated DNA repair dioxygenase AlkB|nr:alpha-ketoglutarate-dependent dioxygenase AlkB [Chitinophagaceae bacterium]